MAKSAVKITSSTSDVIIDANGNKIVQPTYCGSGGSAAGTLAIKR